MSRCLSLDLQSRSRQSMYFSMASTSNKFRLSHLRDVSDSRELRRPLACDLLSSSPSPLVCRFPLPACELHPLNAVTRNAPAAVCFLRAVRSVACIDCDPHASHPYLASPFLSHRPSPCLILSRESESSDLSRLFGTSLRNSLKTCTGTRYFSTCTARDVWPKAPLLLAQSAPVTP